MKKLSSSSQLAWIIYNENRFLYTLLKGKSAKILNSQCIIDFYVPHLRERMQNFSIHNI